MLGQPETQMHPAGWHEIEVTGRQQLADRGDERVAPVPELPPDSAEMARPARRRQHVERDLLEHWRHEQVVLIRPRRSRASTGPQAASLETRKPAAMGLDAERK